MSENVIYLHGFASSPASRKAGFFAGRLRAAGREVAIPDLAAGDFEHLTITSQLDVIRRAAAGKACAVMGSSMGGYLAALYAARHPEVTRVVLLAPAFSFARRWAESWGAGEPWREVYHYAEQAPRRISRALLEDASRYEEYPDVRQPVLAIHGRRDTVAPLADTEEFARRRPHVRLIVMNSDHELADELEPMWEQVREFLL